MKNKINLRIDLRILIGILVAIIIGLLVAWAPWNSAERSDEIIKVTGETVLKAEPDQFVFYPAYQFKNADKAAASAAAANKSVEIVAKLRELGVAESAIKTSVDGYLSQPYPGGPSTQDEYIYTAQVTITVDSKESAQKVQDYIATTSPLYSVTPQGSFSESKKKELEAKARDEATKDARAKAEQSAENLGFKLGRVKSVEDGAGFSEARPLDLKGGDAMMTREATTSSLPVNPGENEIRYSVTVTYFVR
jgi:uncharacterized protein YggE